MAILALGCGDEDTRAAREVCFDAEAEANGVIDACDPSFGDLDYRCDSLFGTATTCHAVNEYFECQANIVCDNGSVVLPTGCALGICD